MRFSTKTKMIFYLILWTIFGLVMANIVYWNSFGFNIIGFLSIWDFIGVSRLSVALIAFVFVITWLGWILLNEKYIENSKNLKSIPHYKVLLYGSVFYIFACIVAGGLEAKWILSSAIGNVSVKLDTETIDNLKFLSGRGKFRFYLSEENTKLYIIKKENLTQHAVLENDNL